MDGLLIGLGCRLFPSEHRALPLRAFSMLTEEGKRAHEEWLASLVLQGEPTEVFDELFGDEVRVVVSKHSFTLQHRCVGEQDWEDYLNDLSFKELWVVLGKFGRCALKELSDEQKRYFVQLENVEAVGSYLQHRFGPHFIALYAVIEIVESDGTHEGKLVLSHAFAEEASPVDLAFIDGDWLFRY